MHLLESTVERLHELGVAAVWLFGSRVGGRPHPQSDTDVAVLLRDDAASSSALEFGRLAHVLAEALGAGDDIDLLVLDQASLEVRVAVLTDGKLLASLDDPRRVAFQVDTFSRWPDVRRALRQQDHAYLERIGRDGLA